MSTFKIPPGIVVSRTTGPKKTGDKRFKLRRVLKDGEVSIEERLTKGEWEEMVKKLWIRKAMTDLEVEIIPGEERDTWVLVRRE